MNLKTVLLDADAVLSNATAELSMPSPDVQKAKRAVDVARDMILKLAEDQEGKDPLSEAKRRLILVYLAMPEDQFNDQDAELFSLLSKDRRLKDEIEQARKNN
jgi:hypothetical protein